MMELTETVAGIDTVALPLPATTAARGEALVSRERLVSLDAMRGFAVIGMIVVNTLASATSDYGYTPASRFLAHSPWAGFTFADFVFPAFIFMCGFSIAVSLRNRSRLDWQIFRRISARTAALLMLGFLVANVTWFGQMDHGDWRLMGVLQRIGLCYFATAILFVSCRPRTRLVVSLLMLLAYWPLTLMSFSHHANLLVPGANFISFVDRSVLGPHALFAGANGFDPEGLLSTFPAIAQCVLGALAGEWLLKNRASASAPLRLAGAGAAMVCLGLAWSPFFPIVKNIWTSSYVLFSSGLSMLLLSFSFWALDRERVKFRGLTILQAFGANALLAYVLQQAAQLLPAGDDMHALGAASMKSAMPGLMANLPIVIFLVMLWLPLEFMRRRRWIVKI
jgi:predicted acyltransferase